MVKPTVAIGIGKAGCRMVNSLSRVAKREGVSSQFEFITIDTNENDLYDYSPEDGNPLPLKKPDDFWEKHMSEFAYLREDFVKPTGQGTVRQRAVSRYHVDHSDNFETLREFLDENISSFVEERVSAIENEEVADVNVWLLNSLGGGTGSGAFPLISALVKRVTDALDYEFFRGGIGSLPRLDGLEEQIQAPAGNGDFYTNAYAALRELRELINYENRTGQYPLEISLEAEHSNIPSDTLQITENPFDMYWLLGFKEGEESRSYRQHMNAVAANGVFFHAAMDSPENFPDDDAVGNHTLYALDAAEIRAPAEEAKRFVSLQQEVRDLETDIEDLEREVESTEGDIAYLNEVRQLDLDYAELQTETEHVDTEVLRQCRNLVNDFDPHAVTDRSVELDDHIETLYRRVEEQLTEGKFDGQNIVSLLYCQQFITLLDEKIAGHRFNEQVDALWDEYREEVRDDLPYLEDDEPIDKWENGFEEWLYQKGSDLKQDAEAITLNRIKKRRLKNEIERLREQIKTAVDYHDEFVQLRELRAESEAKLQSARDTLLDTKQELERKVENLRDTKRSKKANKENKEGKIERKRDQLQQPRKIAGEYTPPLRDLSNLTEALVAETDSIADYIDNQKLDEETLAKMMRNCIQDIDDPVQDVARDDTVNTQSILGIMTNEQNISGSAGNLLNIDVPDRMSIPNQIDAKFDYYDADENLVDLRDGFSIWFVAFYTNLALTNTSEFGTIHEYYTDHGPGLSDLLGDKYRNEDLPLKFAYPELFPDEEDIQSAFTAE